MSCWRRSWDWDRRIVRSGAPTMDKMDNGLSGYLAVALSVASLILAGCASHEGKPDVALQELVLMFPGHYDNTAQVQADIAHGVQPPHEALMLDIVPIAAIMIGENVFYVQESV